MMWEYYYDVIYLEGWAVRPVGDTDFNSPRLFHFVSANQAKECCELLNKAIVRVKRGNDV